MAPNPVAREHLQDSDKQFTEPEPTNTFIKPPELTDYGGRPRCKRRLPARLQDVILHSDGRLLAPLQMDNSLPGLGQLQVDANVEPTQLSRINLVFRGWRTEANQYGVHREYLGRPLEFKPQKLDPQEAFDYNIESTSLEEALGPFPSYSAFHICHWYWSQTGNLSDGHFCQLTKDVYADPLFSQSDVINLDTGKLKNQVASYNFIPLSKKFEWKEQNVPISVPLCAKGPLSSSLPDSATFEVPGFHSRSIVDLYTQIILDYKQSHNFIWIPFKEYYTNGGVQERLYSELYSSDAFISEYHKLQSSPCEPGCQSERLNIGLMLWSDATLLANFGTAKLWPIYMAIGNLSKYIRSQPSTNSMYDVAYLPSVSTYSGGVLAIECNFDN